MGTLIIAGIAALVLYSQYQKAKSNTSSSADVATPDTAPATLTVAPVEVKPTQIIVPAKYTLLPAQIANTSPFIAYTTGLVPQGTRYQSR